MVNHPNDSGQRNGHNPLNNSNPRNGVGRNGPQRFNKKIWKKYVAEGYTLEDVEGYYHALHGAYLSIVSQKPDAIIAPLRGAEILVKSMNLFANLDQNSSMMPIIYYPKTGQIHANVLSNKVKSVGSAYEPSITESEQKREMRRIVDKIIARHKLTKHPGKRIIVTVVDEVVSGGSLTQTIRMLEDIFAEKVGKYNFRLDYNVVAIADSRKQRCPEYNYLKTRRVVKEFPVPRLFTTDALKFLFPLKREDKPRFWTLARTPFHKRGVEVVYTQEAADGRMKLLTDLEILHSHSPARLFGKPRNKGLLRRLPRNAQIKRK
jgi:hypoxanthine phosphoribosyltransferase